jgi:hypothetical protein
MNDMFEFFRELYWLTTPLLYHGPVLSLCCYSLLLGYTCSGTRLGKLATSDSDLWVVVASTLSVCSDDTVTLVVSQSSLLMIVKNVVELSRLSRQTIPDRAPQAIASIVH